VIKRVLTTVAIALACCSHAGAVTFTNSQFDVTALAVTSGTPGFASQSGPPSPTPVSASADSTSTTDVATAGAIGGPGLLTTSADATGGGGIANAVSTAHFSGSFLMSILEPVLNVDFNPLDFAVGSGTSTTSLFITLTSGGKTLFDDLVSGPFSYNLGPGATGVLDLVLTSEVSVGFPEGVGNASSFGLVTIASAVPEPETALLFLIGVGALAAVKRRGSPASRTAI
jgi:hypothetical protein